ncbi:hypothetical protein [Paractinoplanes lichenicola]|uniref:Uncharacterized protein n=1 Tax=Paractinoplanes lichenicola TaxID=2802976 RepID=A0ABS1W5Q4_9ACTN|nr:hypothetical protein [Actinoplanes lichenicola]MBL7262071.1 hypothetical protein [Actinoplanes lichenicola]
MEDNPPPERRKPPRARTSRPPFNAPGEAPPGETPPKRPRKAPPAVTFQPPGAENHPKEPSRTDPGGTRSSGAESPDQPASARRAPAETPPPAKKATPPQKRPAKKVAAAAKTVPAAPVAPAPKATKKATPAKKTPPPPATPEPPSASKPTRSAGPPAPASSPKPAPAVDVEVIKPATHEPPVPQPETDRWAKLLADPVHTPELLALAAVATIGPRARAWAAATSSAYPAATPGALARLATRQFTRFGALTSFFGALAGSYASIALVSTRSLTDAELVLHLAAAHGLDPTDPRRAVDLLVITQVHETVADAEEALATTLGAEPTASGLGDAVWRLGRIFVQRSGSWTVLRAINRYFPGASLLGAVLTSAADAQATAARAVAHFKGLTPR